MLLFLHVWCLCFLQVSYKDSTAALCFKSSSSETPQDCVLIEDRGAVDRVTWNIAQVTNAPGSNIHKALPNIKSTSTCNIYYTFSTPTATTVSHHQFHVLCPAFCIKLTFQRHHVAKRTSNQSLFLK